MTDRSLLDPHFRILGLTAAADLPAVKQAYYRAARANHPDLFPAAERPKRELAMMRINEAYMTLVASADGEPPPSRPGRAPGPPPGPSPADGALGPLKNPDYVYYKRGLENYREGQRKFFDRKNAAGRPQHFVPDRQLLTLAVAALRHFQKAYAYFYRVVSEHPDSIWIRDCRFRLWRLEQYNRIYLRICRRLAEKVIGSPETGTAPAESGNQPSGQP